MYRKRQNCQIHVFFYCKPQTLGRRPPDQRLKESGQRGEEGQSWRMC